ncbi:MAG: energy transducer TonB [Terracidiphilus sp.]
MIVRCSVAFLSVVCCPILYNGAVAQTSPPSEPNGAVYYNENGIKSPELAPTDFSPVVSNNCEYEGAGIVRISLVINAQGNSDQVAPLYPFNDDIDKAAVSVAKVDRFSPGSKDGVPVAVAQELQVKLTVCRVSIVDKDGTTSARIRLKSAPVQKLFPAPKQPLPPLPPIEGQMTATPGSAMQLAKEFAKLHPDYSHPVPLETPEAEWPAEQRGREGICLVSLVIDANGQPQAMRIVRGTNEQFNEKALEAVAKYRFRPAKNGKDPVPVRMSIVVNFRLH